MRFTACADRVDAAAGEIEGSALISVPDVYFRMLTPWFVLKSTMQEVLPRFLPCHT